MTEQEIKQNAEKCARLVLMPFQTLTDEYKGRYEGFIAGAHSRDEEIKELENKVSALETVITTARATISTQEAIIKNLRNPWISVEERLPEKTKGIFSCQVRELEEDKIVYYKDTRGYIHTGYLNARNHWRDLDRDNAAIYPVTHWMPIPELKKGE